MHFPSALLQLVGAIFTLSLCHTRYFQEGSFYICLVFQFLCLVTWFLRLQPRDHISLEFREACVPGSYGTITNRDSVPGRLPLPGYHTDNRLKHTPSLRKRPISLAGRFRLRGRLLVWQAERGLWNYSKGMEAGGYNVCALPLLLSNLPVSCIKELTPFSATLIVVAAARGHCYISWVWWPVEFNACGCHRIATNREAVLKQQPPPGHSKRQQIQELYLSMKQD